VKRSRALLAAALLPLAACGSPKRAWTTQPCELQLTDVLREKAQDPFSVEVTLQLRVRNPNPIPVRLERLRLSVQAGGIDLGVTALPYKPLVGPTGTEIIRVPLMINTHASPGSLGAVEKRSTVYRFVGQLLQVGLDPETGGDNAARTGEYRVQFQGSPE